MWLKLVSLFSALSFIWTGAASAAQTPQNLHLHHQPQYNLTDYRQNDTTTCDLASCIRMIGADDDTPIRTESYSSSVDSYLMTSSIIYGVLLHAPDTELNHLCRSELETLQQAIGHKDIWAMKSKYTYASRVI